MCPVQQAMATTAVTPAKPAALAAAPTETASAATTLDRFVEDYEPRWFRNFVNRHPVLAGSSAAAMAKWHPACDIHETADAYLIQADVPGAKKEDIKLEVIHRTVRISGEVRNEHVTKTDTCHQSERTYGSFVRNLALPDDADIDKIKGEHVNGVLLVTIPKKAVAGSVAVAKSVPVQ